MIKPIDMPTALQRSVDLVQSAQNQLVRGELANEFAGRLTKESAEMQARSVAQTEKSESKRVNDQKDRRGSQQQDDGQQKKKDEGSDYKLPNFGYESEKKLDISI